MIPDCRNDCREPLLFPKRPNNRPGLPHIDYRIGTYSDFREAILRNLNKDPVLSPWTHRRPDDPGIALLEGASILGDILTFYQELYANEAYVRTAQWRESIADLVRLLGYHLSPGLGGKATFTIEVKGDKPVIIPKGFPIKAQVEGLEQPAEFEIIKEFTAIPALSKFYLYRPFYYPDITTGTTKFSIETSVLNKAGVKLNKKDRLMLVVSPMNPQTARQTVVVGDIQERFERTEITVEGGWQGSLVGDEITAYKLGSSFRYFGYNAPLTVTVVQNGVAVQNNVSFSAQVGGLRLHAKAGVYDPLPNLTSFPLDSEVKEISAGSTILISLQLSADPSGTGPTYFFEREITNVTSASVTRGALTGGTTVVELNNEIVLTPLTPSFLYTDIRTVEFHEVVGEKFTLKATRTPIAPADGSSLYYYGDSDSYQKLDGRSIQFVQNEQTEQVLVNIKSASVSLDNQVTLRPLTLNPHLQLFTAEDFPLSDPRVTVYGNLGVATQGKTEKEAVLGNGDSRQPFQTFKLPKLPLTYLNSAGETPPEAPELQVYVSDRLWKRVSSFFGREPKEEIYIVREDANGNSWVQFGDGNTGMRLPSGINNVKAVYRTGTGAYGALKEETTVQAGDKLNRLDKIQLPGIVSGGSSPETGDNAREAAPGKVQSLGRLVSLRDFESETLAISGVSKVSAAWQLVDNIPTVVLTVLMETGRDKEKDEVERIVNNYNTCRGPQRFPVKVDYGKLHYVYVDVVFGLHPAFREELVKKAIKEALGVNGGVDTSIDNPKGLFGIRQRRFGQNEYATRIAGTVQNVEGVIWAKVVSFGSLGEAEDPSELDLPSESKQFNPVVSCDNLHVLSLYTGHLQLSVAAVKSMKEC
ncbi:MAG: hypothetical protein L3J17_12350 [Candidatus Jettenia sp.]|nr:MAG: hypothetical protein L3J17_12350 [Candidatus Jettenia sp.]